MALRTASATRRVGGAALGILCFPTGSPPPYLSRLHEREGIPISRTISPARRAAYLRALEATGNVTIAAERAKVSRRWAQVNRKRDPEFGEACAEAIEAARYRLRMSKGRKPPPGWDYQDGEELVVKGTRGRAAGRRVQIARARLNQISPRVEERFLGVLASCCNVQAAAKAAGVSKGAFYAHRKRWRKFAKLWDEAVERGSDGIELAVVAAGISMLSGETLPEDHPVGPISVDQALLFLQMQEKKKQRMEARRYWRE